MKKSNLILHGKSGCNIEILNQNFNYVLRKTSKNIDENNRHIKRINKQIEFYHKKQTLNIKTPEVFNLYNGSDTKLSYVDMQYIQGKDSLSFLRTASHSEINNFIIQLFSYLDNSLETFSENVSIFKNNEFENSILDKVKQIDTTLNFPRKEIIMKKLYTLPSDLFLRGSCHGDLTFANMIHTAGKIYIFDFLDMFVDSPIFELISIRQDTYHLWSCFIYNDYNCRTTELLTYIDNELKNRYESFIKNKWYDYFSLMNYVRMYRMYDMCHPNKELNFIYNCITEYL
jgi:tRNA A-37 threonylcarbamoyl transferase component Bud32